MAKNQMTPTQRNYAITRIDELVRAKAQAVRKGCLQQKACACRLTYKELAKLIRSGAIEPQKQNQEHIYNSYTDIKDVFDVDACTEHYRPNDIYDEAAYDKKMDVIYIRARTLKDRLMLGDASAALEMISNFEAELANTK